MADLCLCTMLGSTTNHNLVSLVRMCMCVFIQAHFFLFESVYNSSAFLHLAQTILDF